jgi:hypothetical protein
MRYRALLRRGKQATRIDGINRIDRIDSVRVVHFGSFEMNYEIKATDLLFLEDVKVK